MPIRLLIAVLAVLSATLAAQAPSGQRFRSGIDLVTVDVVVLDRDGQPVPGLTRAEFTVLEDGRPQAITDFQSIELPLPDAARDLESPRPPAARRLSSNQLATNRLPGRSLVLVFDDLNLTRQQGAETKAAIRRFLATGVTSQDAVSLVTTSGGGWFHARTPAGLAQLTALLDRHEGKFVYDTSAERMTDFEAMRVHIFQDMIVAARIRRRFESYRVAGLEPTTVPNARDDMPTIGETPGNVGVVEPYIESRAAAAYSAAVARNRVVMRVLERAVEALGTMRGRKSVMLFSKGFIHDQETRGFRTVSEAARRANVAIYFIDARGLVATTSNFTASEGSPTDARDLGAVFADIALDAEGAVSVAEDSGGFAIRDTNDLAAGLDRISRESRTYYLLGYAPENTRADGRFRRLEVKVSRKGLRVRARRGYFAPDAAEPRRDNVGDLDPEVLQALDAPRDLADLPVRATALVFDRATDDAARVIVAADVDPGPFQLEPDADRFTGIVEYAIAATHLETGRVFRFEQTTELNLRPETRRRLEITWYTLARELTLPAGAYQARIVVRDRNSGRIGSVTHDFEVPPPGGFRVSSPILTDQLQSDPAGSAPRPVVVARRTFASGTTLFCQFHVYGATPDPRGEASVSSDWVLRRADGSLVREMPPRPIAPAAGRGFVRLYGISLASLPPGDYELALGVRDALRGGRIEIREPFTVVPGVGLSAAPSRSGEE